MCTAHHFSFPELHFFIFASAIQNQIDIVSYMLGLAWCPNVNGFAWQEHLDCDDLCH